MLSRNLGNSKSAPVACSSAQQKIEGYQAIRGTTTSTQIPASCASLPLAWPTVLLPRRYRPRKRAAHHAQTSYFHRFGNLFRYRSLCVVVGQFHNSTLALMVMGSPPDMQNRPVFIFAIHRSGGTLLTRMLNCHPDLVIWVSMPVL